MQLQALTPMICMGQSIRRNAKFDCPEDQAETLIKCKLAKIPDPEPPADPTPEQLAAQQRKRKGQQNAGNSPQSVGSAAGAGDSAGQELLQGLR